MDQGQNVVVEKAKEDFSYKSFFERINIRKHKKNLLLLFLLVAVVLIISVIYLKNSSSVQKSIVIKKEEKINVIYPGAAYAPDQIMVKYKSTYTQEELLRLRDVFDAIGVVSQEKVFSSDNPALENFYLVKLKPGSDVKTSLEKLLKVKEIERAGPNYLFTAQEIPNDQYFETQWNLTKIKMPEAWSMAKGSANIKVAVIDTGVDYKHPDLIGRVINSPDFSTCGPTDRNNTCAEKARDSDSMDDYSHGTHVAGIIGALTNNDRLGVAGINWNVRIMAIKTMSEMGDTAGGRVGDLLEGIRYAIDNDADVINMSLGAPVPCNDSSVLGFQDVINTARAKGIVLVSAAGNNNVDASHESPASCGGTISVGATDKEDKRAGFSNYGSIVDIAAPGTTILSTVLNGSYGLKQGTSMAAPQVAGVAALLLSAAPNLSADKVRSCLLDNSDPIATDKPIGGRRLNAKKVLEGCSGLPIIPTSTPIPSPTVTPTGLIPFGDGASSSSSLTSGVSPTKAGVKKPTPTPVQTYTCRERSKVKSTPPGTIQIGDLVCVPNK